MRSFLLAFVSLFTTSAFAQDDFYARQLENRQFEDRQFAQQLETRRLETQRVETARVEQARVRKAQDRADQEEADARFSTQQRELASSRSGAPSRFVVPSPSAPRRATRSCRAIQLSDLVVEPRTSGVLEAPSRAVLAAFRGRVDGQTARLVVVAPIDEWGYTTNDGLQIAIHLLGSGTPSWFQRSVEVVTNRYSGSKKKGSFTLDVRHLRLGNARECVEVSGLDVTLEWGH